jgi:catalase
MPGPGQEEAMARVKRSTAELARDELARQTMRAFTADDGRRLAALAGEALAGRRGHALRPGWRPVHTRGVLVEGQFTSFGTAGPHAPEHLATPQALPVWGRLSSCRADPEIDDRKIAPRGLAVRIWLGDGRSTDLLGMSVDRFPAASLDAFVSVSHALSSPWVQRLPRVAILKLLRQFRGLRTTLTAFAPSSYGRCDYYAIHTFLWVRDGEQPVRYRWRAEDGRDRPLPWRSWGRPTDYLQARLVKRLNDERRPIRFGLEIQQPRDVDRSRLVDVGRPLPRRVEWVRVGMLELQHVVDDPVVAKEWDGILFSPCHLIEGIEPFPGDEIMTARAAAYPASHVARSGYWP